MADGASKLSEEQIYECLKSLNVPVRMNDLKVPTREFLVRVFECFVRDLEIDITGHEVRTWEATNHLEETDIYEEPMYLILLAMAVDHVTNPCGLSISIKDIVEPKPKRTKKILNYLLVFWNFYIRKYARFHDIDATYGEERKKLEDLLVDNQSLDEKYSDMLNVLQSMQPSKDELSDIVAVKEVKVSKLKMESDAIVAEYQSMKTKEGEIRNAISAADVRAVTAKQKIEELDQLILSSPERINVEIQKLQDKIKAEDFKIKEIESKCKEKEKQLQFLEECQIEEEKDVKVLDDLTQTINHLGETAKCIVSSQQKIEEEDDRLRRLQMDVDRKEESKLQQDQKSAKILLGSKKHIETLQEVLKMNLNKKASEEKDIESLEGAIAEIRKKIESKKSSIEVTHIQRKDALEGQKARHAEYLSKMKAVTTSFESDCTEVIEHIERVFPNIQPN